MFNYKLIYETTSPFSGEIKVIENNHGRRLVVGGYTQSRSLKESGRSKGYWDAFVEFDPPKTGLKEILILGLGAGTMAKLLTRKFGPVPIDAIEIDPVIAEVAKSYFDLKERNVKIIIADAADYLCRTTKKYDLICVDAFQWGDVPSQCERDEFYQNLAQALNTDGVVIFNRILNDDEGEKINEYADFLESFFDGVEILTVPGGLRSSNIIFYAKGK